VFFTTGFVVAAWATRIPAVQQRLSLGPGGFAVAVLERNIPRVLSRDRWLASPAGATPADPTGMKPLGGLRRGAWAGSLLGSRPDGQWTSPARPAGQAELEALRAATIPTDRGGRSPLRTRAWLVLLVAVLVAVGAGYAITRVHDYAADRAELRALLGQLETVRRSPNRG
jgi:hypothetical protein